MRKQLGGQGKGGLWIILEGLTDRLCRQSTRLITKICITNAKSLKMIFPLSHVSFDLTCNNFFVDQGPRRFLLFSYKLPSFYLNKIYASLFHIPAPPGAVRQNPYSLQLLKQVNNWSHPTSRERNRFETECCQSKDTPPENVWTESSHGLPATKHFKICLL